jgi:hypothetical protein
LISNTVDEVRKHYSINPTQNLSGSKSRLQ